MKEKNDWATPSMKEYVFWREGMTPEEFEKEREYYIRHLKEVKEGKYKPLWQQ